MEKDRKIERLIKESGLVSAPENFSAQVMDRISSEPEKVTYKPLIGGFGKLFILMLSLVAITISIIYSEPTGFLDERNIKMPEWNLNLQNLPDFNFSTGLLAAMLAVFILVVTDSAVRKRNFV